MPEPAYRERRFTAPDGLGLYFRDYGDPGSAATPVLCLGGLTRNAKDFDALARRVARERRVLCPDLRGRGRSDYDPNWRNYPATYLNDIAHLLTVAASIASWWSEPRSAGYWRWRWARRCRRRAGAVLNDIGPEIERGGLEPILSYIRVDRPQPNWESAVRTIRTLLPDLVYQDEAMFEAMARNTYREGDDGLLHFGT